ncbi:MAG: DUF2384 domain-containing protein [Chitinophagaceae bacterium]|nr:DUF2384 domain-containing protein [Chitinophagaceae bacterium]
MALFDLDGTLADYDGQLIKQRDIKDLDLAKCWLNLKSDILGAHLPLQLIESEEGAVVVLDELGKIVHSLINVPFRKIGGPWM